MKKAALAFLLVLCAATAPRAAWWAENDYVTGADGLKKNNLSVYGRSGRNLILGGSAGFYKHQAAGGEKVYALRAPVMYSSRRHFFSFTPFLYPHASGPDASAWGGRAYLQTSVTEPEDENYFNYTVAAAAARQKTAAGSFSEHALELQAEKSYFGHFFLLGSAAVFGKSGVSGSGPAGAVLDHSDLAYLGVFPQVTGLPDWALTAQMTRSMKPEFDSHLYLGYSRIALRRAPQLTSAALGMKLELSRKTTLDLAYDLVFSGGDRKGYYKILLRAVF